MSNENQFEQWCKTVMSDDADFCMEYGAYQNLNVRIRWEAWQAAAKSMQSAELQQKLTESERYGRQADITIENLERKVEQLAAENAGLKELIEQHAGSFAVCPNCSHEEPSETDDIVALYRSMETPATDAILAEVRASGVDAAIERLHKKFEGTGRIGVPVMALEWLAKEIRQESAK